MWLWIVSSVASGLLGSASAGWFGQTKAGKWCYDKWLDISWWANEKYGIDILDKEEISWTQKYPKAAKRLNDLERRMEKFEKENKIVNYSPDIKQGELDLKDGHGS
tara:strand:- start:755 stop:1072 length:318 start_codon:yes stop_codon:yes gene_type:complete